MSGGPIIMRTQCRIAVMLCLLLCWPREISARDFPVHIKSDPQKTHLVISPDGSRAALVHLASAGYVNTGYAVQLNGDYRDIDAEWTGSPVFSATGIMAYDRSDKRGKSAVIVDGRGTARRIVGASGIRINRDGSNYLYKKSMPGSDRSFLCDTDRCRGPFDEVTWYGFNPEGSLFGVVAREIAAPQRERAPILRNNPRAVEKPDPRNRVIINGRSFGPYEIVFDKPVFSDRGGRYAFSYLEGSAYYCVVDGTTLGPFDTQRDAVFSPDGSRYYLVSRDNRNQELFIGDRRIAGPFRSIDRLTLSDTGGSFAFIGRRAGPIDTCYNYGCAPVVLLGRHAEHCCSFKWLNVMVSTGPGDVAGRYSAFVQFNDRRLSGFDSASGLAINRAGNSIAFVLERSDKKFVRFNDREYGPYDFVLGPHLDDSGKHLLFYFQVGSLSRGLRYVLRHDDREYEIRDRPIRIGFTADGTRSCCVFEAKKRVYLMVDGISRGPYDAADFVIRENRIFTAWVAKGRLFLEEAR